MDDMTQRLYATTDAMVWAEEWCKVARRIAAEGGEIIDEGWMVGWFANAFGTADMHSKAARLAEALRLTQEYVGSDTLPPIEGWSWFDALTDYYGEPFVPADQRPRTPPDPNEVAVTNG